MQSIINIAVASLPFALGVCKVNLSEQRETKLLVLNGVARHFEAKSSHRHISTLLAVFTEGAQEMGGGLRILRDSSIPMFNDENHQPQTLTLNRSKRCIHPQAEVMTIRPLF